MRDEMDGRIWTASHGHFSESLGQGLANLGRSLRAIPPAIPKQLIAGIGAFGLALLTIGGSVA